MLAFSLVMTLGSCGETASGTENASGYVINETNLTEYQIVRSDYAEGDLVQCGMDVRYAFENAGYDLKLTTDFFREGYPEYAMGEYEILVGETNRPETIEFLENLQMWQYGYALVGQKIVIAGHDDASTRLAVEEFRTFLAGQENFSFSEADNYIYGEVKKGTGKVYSVLTFDFTRSGESDVLAEIEEYSPDFVILQNADFAAAGAFLPEGYAPGADFAPDGTENGRRELMYYNTDTYTYSSEGHLMMSQMPMLTADEKGWFSYCVVRCAETQEKYVFCAADLSDVPRDGVKDRMKVFGNFAEHCGTLPVLFGGFFDGSADSPAGSLLTDYGYADVMRLASEAEGECTDKYLYASYNNIAVVRSVVTGHGLYTEFQRAE
jgi:hypothetical protein